MLQAGLIPGSSIGMGDKGTGCFAPGEGVTKGKPMVQFTVHAFEHVSVPTAGNINS